MRKNKTTQLTTEQVKHIARLANLNLSEKQLVELQTSLTKTLDYVSKVQSLDTKTVKETNQITNLENVTREDKIDTRRILSQTEALKPAPKTHNGYFVVKAILES